MFSHFNDKLHRFINPTTKDTYVIARYIDNPLLIGGKKFDLRLYVLAGNRAARRTYTNVGMDETSYGVFETDFSEEGGE